MRFTLRTVFFEKQKVAKLFNLSKKTRIPQAVLVREGIDLMLKKREKQLSGKQKRGKTLKLGRKKEGR